MLMYARIKSKIRFTAFRLKAKLSPAKRKEANELAYWKKKKQEEGVLTNRHYEYFYTSHFDLNASYYDNKVILDIGCGPRGSLEWASMASRRIGLDPLADEYCRLGASHHRMEYINAPSERIPLENYSCDAVFSFNSLDHVEDIEQTISEFKRITRPGGIFLLLVEINHPPTACEPHNVTPKNLLDSLRPEFTCENLKVYKPKENGMYSSIQLGETLSKPEETSEQGYLSGKFIRNATDNKSFR